VQTDPTAPVRVDIMGNGFLDVLHARDISRGGLGIRVPHGFEGCDIDNEVGLIITLGRARPFKAKGVIRHFSRTAEDHVFGLEFVGLAPDQVAAVEAYIQACLRRRSRAGMRAAALAARG
jgi:PilZ domain-containing protein